MKNYLTKAVALIFVVLLFAGSVSAQKHYVKVKPQEQEVAEQSRSSAPGENYVWKTGNFRWSNGRYVWNPGSWVHPPFPAARWNSGRWVNTRFGWYWINGYWSRRRH
jgi:hypothetical protein